MQIFNRRHHFTHDSTSKSRAQHTCDKPRHNLYTISENKDCRKTCLRNIQYSTTFGNYLKQKHSQ